MDTALRSDAQRNLARVVEAAREVFAEQGLDACVAEVARRAGVGTGTIFRRFPTKEDLLAAVVEHRLRDVLAEAQRAAAASDPAKGLRQFMTWAAETLIGDRCFCRAGEFVIDKRSPPESAVEDDDDDEDWKKGIAD